jgi:hypothetical protein
MLNGDKIDHHIKETQDHLEVIPSLLAFERTMQKLEAEKSRRRRFALWFSLGVMLLLGAGGAVYYVAAPAKPAPILAETTKQNPPAQQPAEANSNKTVNAENIQSKTSGTNSNNTAAPITPAQSTIPVTPHNTHAQSPIPVIPNKSVSSTAVVVASSPASAHIGTVTVHRTPDPVIAEKAEVTEDAVLLPILASLPSTCFFLPFNYPDTLVTCCTSPPLADPGMQPAVNKTASVIRFAGGLTFNPQFCKYAYTQNPYANPGSNFADAYYAAKSWSALYTQNYAAQLRFGATVNGKWEILSGLGYEQLTYTEQMLESTTSTSSTYIGPSGPGIQPSGIYVVSSTAVSKSIVTNTFTYLTGNLQCNRLLETRMVTFKLGLGLRADYLLHANVYLLNAPDAYTYNENYRGPELSRWIVIPQAQVGVVKNIRPKLQLQLCADAFSSTTSLFTKDYLISQRSYGVGLEGTVLYFFR